MIDIRERYARSLEDFYAYNLMVMKGKSEDYSEVADPFSNFRFAALAAGVTIEQVFLVLKGIKLARLKQLLVGNKVPNNESTEDTLGDDSNYSAILSSYLDLKNSTDPSYAFGGEGPEDEEAEEWEADELPADIHRPTIGHVNLQGVFIADEPATVTAEPELSPAKRLFNFFGIKN